MKRSYVSIKKRFFHPDIRYQDLLKPNNLIAHVKLQEFAQRVIAILNDSQTRRNPVS